ncbi:fibrinogen C domain-containing protein 1-B-like [Clytia hemisphaerica]|uniref:fibrinogen C domain-containing protein 1-B-like n=1 Tax=Clytia hemisphaerica TaxID=252671 RepID=UPI0034D69332
MATLHLLVLLAMVHGLTAHVLRANQEIQILKTKDRTRNTYCQVTSALCGDCLCVEDYNLVEKFYCDCRNKPKLRDCKAHYENGERINGLYLIHNDIKGAVVQVFCDQNDDKGGWTVIQRRVDGSTNFQRNWNAYKNGFGQLQREFWLGNHHIHQLTAQAFLRGTTVRFDMIRRSDSKKVWAKYSTFSVNAEATKYQLAISGYSGIAGDHMRKHSGNKFSTFDQDNDDYSSDNCASSNDGAWWFYGCHMVNLNGAFDALLNQHRWHAIWWGSDYDDGRMMFSEIKVRRN